jgi:glycosyltransferase involved in cell wall biosynthesis
MFLHPAAGRAALVVSDHAAYRHAAHDSRTALVVGDTSVDWAEALTTLVQDDEQRRALAMAAAQYLHRERTLAVRAGDWPAAITALVDRRR